MDTAYQQAAAKRHVKSSEGNKKAEKRRLIQLGVSLALFCIVFLGRNAFPELCNTLGSMISKDASIEKMLEEFGNEIAHDKSLLAALKNMTAATFGYPEQEADPAASPNTDQIVQNPIEITPLSQTKQLGLFYYRENGLREYKSEHSENDETEDQILEHEAVTAVAQAYNEKGEALPRNVSYQYYELGLDQTVVPVFGEVTSGFEYRTSPISGKREFHLALDIAAPKGTEISAFADGVVRYIGESDDFGLYLMIDHDNGVATFYAHCSKLLVHKGDEVSCGETVALVGNTGNATGYHLHFTIEKDNIRLDPAYYVDPQQ